MTTVKGAATVPVTNLIEARSSRPVAEAVPPAPRFERSLAEANTRLKPAARRAEQPALRDEAPAKVERDADQRRDVETRQRRRTDASTDKADDSARSTRQADRSDESVTTESRSQLQKDDEGARPASDGKASTDAKTQAAKPATAGGTPGTTAASTALPALTHAKAPAVPTSAPPVQLSTNASAQPVAPAPTPDLAPHTGTGADAGHADTGDASTDSQQTSTSSASPATAAANRPGDGTPSFTLFTAAGSAAPAVEAMAPVSASAPDVRPVAPPGSPAPMLQSPPGAEGDMQSTQLNSARLARGLQNALNQQGGSVTLRLTPPEMGTVRIQLQLGAGTVSAQFHAETASARTLLQQQFTQLRQALEGQGLSVERLSVQPMSPTPSSSHGSATAQQHQPQSQADGTPDDGRSRGQYARQDGDASRQHDGTDARRRAIFERLLNEVG